MIKKVLVSFDTNDLKEFSSYCDDSGISFSKLVNLATKNYLKQKKSDMQIFNRENLIYLIFEDLENNGKISEYLTKFISNKFDLSKVKSSKPEVKENIVSSFGQPTHRKEDLEPLIKLNLERDREETDNKTGEDKHRAALKEWNSLNSVNRNYPSLFDANRFSYLESFLDQWEKQQKKK
jgi:hypothetical protein